MWGRLGVLIVQLYLPTRWVKFADWSEGEVREEKTYTFALRKLGCYSSSNHIMPGSIISAIEI